MTFWTADKTADLEQRWNDGQSAGFIAEALGTTRGAIMGKVDRLGLSYRITTTIKRQPRKIADKRPPRPRTLARYSPVTRTRQAHEYIMVNAPKNEPTKNELRAILRQAVLNTAAMQ